MSTPKSLRLGWIGLGSMGLAMAKNIQKYLIENNYPNIRYSNRTISRGESLGELGGIPCRSIAELTQNCDVIFISVRILYVIGRGLVKVVSRSVMTPPPSLLPRKSPLLVLSHLRSFWTPQPYIPQPQHLSPGIFMKQAAPLLQPLSSVPRQLLRPGNC